ncbi:FCD domain-containing protein [Acetobacteraceae bacterium KSS8]|uniref:FCD domain-containing protein n=1 Tax=Endosaccharibacter trunci TaxID=2812733 RepID=A0ABT1WAY6_9PROT|nr:FCD domain-containing protein [Acetobacteraceae bacterium KSS8]
MAQIVEPEAGIDPPSAVEAVVAQMRALIRERKLGVGDVLPSEIELGAMFSASRNTIREAVRTLRAYGMVESRKKVGAILVDGRLGAMTDLFSFAMEISADTFRDIQGFRRLTEMNLFDVIVGRIDDAGFEALAALNAAMAATASVAEASELDYRFHRRLIDAAENRTLSDIYAMLEPVIRRLMEVGKSRREALHAVAVEHADILLALRQRDRIAFSYHMNRHLDAGLQFFAVSAKADQQPEPAGRAVREAS